MIVTLTPEVPPVTFFPKPDKHAGRLIFTIERQTDIATVSVIFAITTANLVLRSIPTCASGTHPPGAEAARSPHGSIGRESLT